VDCAVTGSSDGTSKDPKFSLQRVFEHNIFPVVAKLIAPGGKYEGYQPIGTGDCAGPHVEQKFLDFLREACAREGWIWEPQAAQMPHINVLDLAVFPCISRRHTALARKRGGLHVRIAKKVINNNGDNTFLGEEKGISCGVREDFHDTLGGVRR